MYVLCRTSCRNRWSTWTRCTRRATACRRNNNSPRNCNRTRNPKTWWDWSWKNEPGRGGRIANLPAVCSSNNRHRTTIGQPTTIAVNNFAIATDLHRDAHYVIVSRIPCSISSPSAPDKIQIYIFSYENAETGTRLTDDRIIGASKCTN